MIDRDHTFEILPSETATDGIPFGIGHDVSVDAEGFTPGSTDWAVQDAEDSTTGVTLFGRDRLVGPTWNWQAHVNRQDVVQAVATLEVFKSAWQALHIRETPGAMLPIRYQIAGRQRRIYGRPRRFEAPPSNLILSGYIPVSMDFKCVDGFTYDDVMDEVVIGINSSMNDPGVDSGGGWIFPVTFPYVPLPPVRQDRQIVVGGTTAARPIVRFDGPVVNPTLTTNGWTLTVEYNLPAGQYIEVDTRPWRQTVLLNGTTSLAGLVGRRTRMSRLRLDPGRLTARYAGFSSSTSTCRIRWANTWQSL